ncbi:MAG: glycosyltransferase N-terminal domain-containing protein [Bacteroidota bacterium]
MGSLIYKLTHLLFRLSLRIAAPFNEKASAFVKGRSDLFKELSETFANNSAPVIWFHCASLGEFEQGRPVIEHFKSEYPEFKILLTFFSPSGFTVRKDYDGADFVFYLPVDTSTKAKKFIRIVKPSVAIFVKYEFWHYYIRTLKENRVPILSISSIFRPSQIYFSILGGFHRKILKNISRFFVQNDKSQELLTKIGINNITVAGDTRFDRVYEICQKVQRTKELEEFKRPKKLMVVGSCWQEDMNIVSPFINHHDMRFIIAPHEIGESFLNAIEESIEKQCIRYSEFVKNGRTDCDILIIDNIGMLSSLYSYADYAYVGGAFGAGLHNILEPATFGLPIIFGNKNYSKFNEAQDLIKLGSALCMLASS